MAGEEAAPGAESGAAAAAPSPPPAPAPLTPAEAAARARAFLALLWRRYLAALSARPLRTKARPNESAVRSVAPLSVLSRCCAVSDRAGRAAAQCLTAGGVAAASDVIAQTLTAPQLAVPRTLKFALFGCFWSGPALHYCASLQCTSLPVLHAGLMSLA